MKQYRLSPWFAVVWALANIAPAAEFKFPTRTLTVPEGFEIELVAGPPLVDRPITMDFDEQGRLYVADSSGSNDKVDKQLQDKPHRIVRLEDSDGDGRLDKSVVFADQMMFPEGTLWFDGSLYVTAPPSIWKLTDTDGDGVADRREEWHQGKTLTGCANDLHGPYLGLDGWIYWAKGAFAEQTYTLDSGKTFKTRAAHLFRKRPDGSRFEAVMTGGMDNPVDVVALPNGERFFTTTFVHQPQAGKRDGLVHAVYGGVYGKVHDDVLADHRKTGDLMPVMVMWGPSAPCGLTRLESRAFGAEYQDNLFACLFNLHKVTRHALTPDGATFRSADTDFVTSDSTDFHPTDVIEDADGSLLIVDTGGWYKICCPTSQLYKPDVLGAIYRVRRRGAAKPGDPRGRKIEWASLPADRLTVLLDDERPAVRRRAIHQLAKLGSAAVSHLDMRAWASVERRRNALWALTRIDSAEARAAVRAELNDRDDSVRQVALHSISAWRDKEAVPALTKLLRDANPQIRRVSAEALGRIGDASAVPALLTACAELGSAPDRVLEHSLIFALIEIDAPEITRLALASRDLTSRRAALIALDQMEHGGLKPEDVTPLLSSDDSKLQQTASWVLNHRPDWGAALARYFTEQVSRPDLDDLARANALHRVAPFVRDPAIQALLAAKAGNVAEPIKIRLAALRVMAESGLRTQPVAWTDALNVCLGSSDEAFLRASVAALRSMPPMTTNQPTLTGPLLRYARDTNRPAESRLDALAAIPGGLPSVEPSLFDFLRAHLDTAHPVATRGAAAGVLAKAKLNHEQQSALIDALKNVGPLELTKVLPVFAACTNEALGRQLLGALKDAKSASALRPEVVTPCLTNFPAAVRNEAQAWLASLNADAAKQKAHLDALLSSTTGGDVRRGQAIFNSAKAACASCHAIGYLGGRLGPDLTKIGQVRNERDLLESIVFPSSSFVRSYEPVVVVTKAGENFNGVLRKDAADEVTLGTGPDVEVRIARADIAEVRPGTVSVMPQGLDEQLSRQELADLMAFLKATRW